MILRLGSYTGCAGLAVVLDKDAGKQPSVVVADELKGLACSGEIFQRSGNCVC